MELYLALLFVGVICLLLLINVTSKKRSSRLSEQEKSKIVQWWNEVLSLKNSGVPSQIKEAVIKADMLTDYLLKLLYPSVDTLVERYKKVEVLFTDKKEYDALWFAHKVRNELVHNVEFDFPTHTVDEVLEGYSRLLENLQIK